jgi:hypothetical protein
MAGAHITPDTRCSFAPGATTDDSDAFPSMGNGGDGARWSSTLETRDSRNGYGWASESSLLMTHADVLAPGPAPALGVDEDNQSLTEELLFDRGADIPNSSGRNSMEEYVIRFWPWVNQVSRATPAVQMLAGARNNTPASACMWKTRSPFSVGR